MALQEILNNILMISFTVFFVSIVAATVVLVYKFIKEF